jgi:hypothetical protein
VVLKGVPSRTVSVDVTVELTLGGVTVSAAKLEMANTYQQDFLALGVCCYCFKLVCCWESGTECGGPRQRSFCRKTPKRTVAARAGLCLRAHDLDSQVRIGSEFLTLPHSSSIFSMSVTNRQAAGN